MNILQKKNIYVGKVVPLLFHFLNVFWPFNVGCPDQHLIGLRQNFASNNISVSKSKIYHHGALLEERRVNI